jgi:hypothetical protein
MRLARNVQLATATALTAMGILTTSAFAQSIEIHPEGDSTHCDEVTIGASHSVTGGCMVHITSEDNTQTMSHSDIAEIITSDCSNQFTAYIAEDGIGYIAATDTSIGTNPPSGCVITPCDEVSGGGETTHPELEWPISGISEYGAGREAMDFTFCIRPFNTAESVSNTFCTVIIDIVNNSSPHQQELIADQEPCFQNPTFELSGHWLTETVFHGEEVAIEPEHIHYP